MINVGQWDTAVRLWAARGSSYEGYVGSLLYLLGSLVSLALKCVSVAAGVDTASVYEWVAQYGMGLLSPLLYTAAAIVQFRYNRKAKWHEYVFWLCTFYMIGCVCFAFAAAVSFPGRSFSRAEVDWLINVPRLVGSAAFLVGSWISLHMWKAEQFGLGKLPTNR